MKRLITLIAGIIGIIVSIYFSFRGLIDLIRIKRWGEFCGYIAFIVTVPIIGYYCFIINDNKHLGNWLLFIIVSLLIPWLFVGFFIRGTVETIKSGKHESSNFPIEQRIKGFFLLIGAIMLWIYGATHNELSMGYQIVLWLIIFYAGAAGLFWVMKIDME